LNKLNETPRSRATGSFITDYNLAFASYLMAMAPLVIIYTVAQKWVVSGITKGSIK